MSFTAGHLPIYGIVGAILCLFYVLRFVLKFLSNPVGSIPGPFYSRCTSYVLMRKLVKGLKMKYVHSLHRKYGPVVRIAPNEVSIADVPTVRHIHNVSSKFLKSDWYTNRVGGGQVVMFTDHDPVTHAQTRRLLGHAMTETNLTTGGFEDMIRDKADRWAERVQADMTKYGSVNFTNWDTFYTTDTIGEMTFGSSFETLETGGKTQYAKDLERGAKIRNILGYVPIIRLLGRVFPVSILKEIVDIEARIDDYAAQSIRRHRVAVATDPDNTKPTLFSKLYALNSKDALAQDRMTDSRITGEAKGYIIAGTETTSSTLTFLLYEMARHPDFQRKLSEEVNALPEGYRSKDLREAKWLNHVIDETLRLDGAVGTGLPRVVPADGLETCGHFIPYGTVVSTQQYTFHRDPTIFADAEKYDPHRWDNPTKEMQDAFMPFNIGSRSCIGKNVALMELRHAVAALYRARPEGLEVVEGEADMEMMDYFITRARGRCILRPRGAGSEMAERARV